LRLVTGSDDRTARVWDARTGAELLILKEHADAVRSAAFSSDGSRLVTGNEDRTARVWNAKTGAEVFILKGHTGPVCATAFSPDGSRLVTGSYDGTAKVWDAKSGAEVLTLKGLGFVSSAAFSPDGSRVLTGGDTIAKVWDATGVPRAGGVGDAPRSPVGNGPFGRRAPDAPASDPNGTRKVEGKEPKKRPTIPKKTSGR
jgi:WD40 repeat protein